MLGSTGELPGVKGSFWRGKAFSKHEINRLVTSQFHFLVPGGLPAKSTGSLQVPLFPRSQTPATTQVVPLVLGWLHVPAAEREVGLLERASHPKLRSEPQVLLQLALQDLVSSTNGDAVRDMSGFTTSS